jgi:TRAP-type C4-dicarboxylate transport system permease small subunit
MTSPSNKGGVIQNNGSPFVRFLRASSSVLGAFEKQVAALSMIVIMFAIAATIVVRLFNLPLPSLGEIAVVAMSPLTFIGGALCSHLHQHITIDVVELMPNSVFKTLLRGLSALSMAVFGGIFTWLAWNLFNYAYETGEQLIDLGTPIWIPTGCMVIGAALICIHSIIDLLLVVMVRNREVSL